MLYSRTLILYSMPYCRELQVDSLLHKSGPAPSYGKLLYIELPTSRKNCAGYYHYPPTSLQNLLSRRLVCNSHLWQDLSLLWCNLIRAQMKWTSRPSISWLSTNISHQGTQKQWNSCLSLNKVLTTQMPLGFSFSKLIEYLNWATVILQPKSRVCSSIFWVFVACEVGNISVEIQIGFLQPIFNVLAIIWLFKDMFARCVRSGSIKGFGLDSRC